MNVLYRLAEWDREKTYKIEGMVYPDNRLVEFRLQNAVLISDEEFRDPEV